MKLHFIGADHEVTGSLHYVEAAGLRILVDCGMEQGRNYYENAPLPIRYSDVDYILLTLSLIHISEPTRRITRSRMPSSA